MKETMEVRTDCKRCEAYLADLLLDAGFMAAHPGIAEHMETCAQCRGEFEELQATLSILDEWSAPEPSPYFDSKLHAALREFRASEPETAWSRLRRLMPFSIGLSFRPAMAGALAAVVVLGGGTFAGLYKHAPVQAKISPTVNDLKILDNNAQALQQMDQLLDAKDDGSAPPTT